MNTPIDFNNFTYHQLVEAIAKENGLPDDITIELYTLEGYPMACNPDACLAKLNEWILTDYGNNLLLYAIPRLREFQHRENRCDNYTGVVGTDVLNIQHLPLMYKSSVNVDCEKHTLKYLLRRIVRETGIPLYLISFTFKDLIYNEACIDQCLKEIGLEHNNAVLNLIIDTDYWESRWDNNFNFNICKPTWLTTQTKFGLSYFYSLLWTVSVWLSNELNSPVKNRILGHIRLLTACPPLIHALNLLFSKVALSLPHRVAIQEILFLLFDKLRPKCSKDLMTKIIPINLEEITEYSHIFWTYLIGKALKIHQESEQFILYELTCHVSFQKMKEPVFIRYPTGTTQIVDRETLKRIAITENSIDIEMLNDYTRIIRSFPISDTTALVWQCPRWDDNNNIPIANNITQEEWLNLLDVSVEEYPFLIIQSPTKIRDHLWSFFPCIIPLVGKYVCTCLDRSKGRDRKTPIHDVIIGEWFLVDIDVLDMHIKEVGLEWCSVSNENLRSITRDNIRAITRIPSELILVLLDVSLSMEETAYHFTQVSEAKKIDMVHRAFLMFADRTKAYNFHHLIGLIPFAESATLAFPLSESFEAFVRKLENLPLKSCTALYDAIFFANEVFAEFASNHPQLVQGVQKRILCLTDGIDRHSKAAAEEALKVLIDNEIIMDLMLLCDDDVLISENAKAHYIAKLSGGYSFYPKSEIELYKLLELETLISLQCRLETVPFFKTDEEINFLDIDYPPFDYDPPYALPKNASVRVEMIEKCLSQIVRERRRSSHSALRGKKIHILQQLAYFHKNKDTNIPLLVFPCIEDITFWQVLFEGPNNSPYEGGVFRLYLDFEGEYPIKPPKVRFLTPIYHCNINSVGRVCHAILDQFYASNVKVRDILYYVYHLLTDPEPDDPLNTMQAEELKHTPEIYHKTATEHTQQYAKHKTMTELKIELLGGEEVVNKYTEDTSLICPLTLELFSNPVVTITEGLTYEKKAILDYIDLHQCDPITHSLLGEHQLIPNLAIARQTANIRAEFDELSI